MVTALHLFPTCRQWSHADYRRQLAVEEHRQIAAWMGRDDY